MGGGDVFRAVINGLIWRDALNDDDDDELTLHEVFDDRVERMLAYYTLCKRNAFTSHWNHPSLRL